MTAAKSPCERPAKITDMQTHELLLGKHVCCDMLIIRHSEAEASSCHPQDIYMHCCSAPAGTDSMGLWSSNRAAASKPKQAAPCTFFCQTRRSAQCPCHWALVRIADRQYGTAI